MGHPLPSPARRQFPQPAAVGSWRWYSNDVRPTLVCRGWEDSKNGLGLRVRPLGRVRRGNCRAPRGARGGAARRVGRRDRDEHRDGDSRRGRARRTRRDRVQRRDGCRHHGHVERHPRRRRRRAAVHGAVPRRRKCLLAGLRTGCARLDYGSADPHEQQRLGCWRIRLRSCVRRSHHRSAAGVLAAVRGASLEDILDSGAPTRRGPGRPPKSATLAGAASPPVSAPARGARGGKRLRRSANDITSTSEQIVAHVGKHPKGIRGEQVRKDLGIAKNHWMKPLGMALGSKRIRKTGEKRATLYFPAR
jgi:hypothetical protein